MTCPSRHVPATALSLALILAVAGCAGASPRSRADVGAQAACRARTDQAFTQQNRGAIYSADTYGSNVRDSPYASSGLPGITTRGLSDEYSRGNMMQACLQGIGAAPGTAVDVSGPLTAPAPR